MSTDSPKTASRRQVLAAAATAGGGACALALGLGALAGTQKGAKAAAALRPPGALAEDAFLAACARCGLCVQACPYDTLKLSGLGGPAQAGTPYFTAREIPCEMCDDVPCVPACPTGALDPGLTSIDDARMGVAVLVDQEHCLNFLGLRCDVCYRVCPVIDTAITLEQTHNTRTQRHAVFAPTVHAEACTGCGKCEKSCVLPVAAIKVLPRDLAVAEPAAHYRLGWEEKRKRGEALIDGIIDLPDRGYTPPPVDGGFKP
jgi:ferredoxin-type protein NapG